MNLSIVHSLKHSIPSSGLHLIAFDFHRQRRKRSQLTSTIFCALLAGALFLFPSVYATGLLGPCVRQEACSTPLRCQATTPNTTIEQCQFNNGYCVCAMRQIDELFCTTQADCREIESCLRAPPGLIELFDFFNGRSICLDNTQIPFFTNPIRCQDDDDCGSEGVCAEYLRTRMCAKKVSELEQDLFPTAQPSGDEKNDENSNSDACIAVESIRIPREMFVNSRHVPARVLCDENRSCATKGHIVQFRGKPMMMQTYCLKVGCSDALMYVNTPRYTSYNKFPSKTKGLLFTTFAARYNSLIEEFLLRIAVHMGL